jgi:hypothetical protein
MGSTTESQNPGSNNPLAIRVIAEVFDELVRKDCQFCILHGLENYPDRIGRDIDIMVVPSEVNTIFEHVRRILERGGWEVGVHTMTIGVNQVFARQRDSEGKSYWLEIDLIHQHPFCWMGQEIVPTTFAKSDVVNENGWPVYPWGWFAKNILIQALAGNEEKFRANSKEFQKHPTFIPRVRAKSDELGFTGVTELLVTETTSTPFIQIRNRARKHMVLRGCLPVNWIRDLRSLTPWFKKTLKLHFPNRGCAPKVHLVCLPAFRIEDLLDLLLEYFNVSFPFTSVTLKQGRILPSAGKTFIARAGQLRTDGMAYQLRDSSRIVLRIETWGSIKEVPHDMDSRITPGDFVHEVKSTDLIAEVKTLGEAVSDAFLTNLNPRT